MSWNAKVFNFALIWGLLLAFVQALGTERSLPYGALAIRAMAVVGVLLVVVAAAPLVLKLSRTVVPYLILAVMSGSGMYVAWEFHWFSSIVASAAILGAVVWLARRFGLLERGSVLLNDRFRVGTPLGAGWDQVQLGSPTHMLSVQPGKGLRVGWVFGQPQQQSGYLLKKLPSDPLVVDAELTAGKYDAGWDPGLHFYPLGSTDGCLAVSLIPKGYPPGQGHTEDGLSLRTQDPDAPGWKDYPRVHVPSAGSIRVKITIQGMTASIRRGIDEQTVQLACAPEELVVGAFKWSGNHAWNTAEHFIRWIRVRKL